MPALKVLHISDYYPGIHNNCGGAEVIAGRITEILSEAGFYQGLFTTTIEHRNNAPDHLELFETQTLEDHLPGKPWLTAVKSQLLPFDPLIESQLDQTIEKFRPDAALIHNTKRLTFSVTAICRRKGIPTGCMIYDYTHFCPAGMLVDYRGKLCSTPGDNCALCHSRQAKKIKEWSKALLPLRPLFFSLLTDSVDMFFTLSEASRNLLVHLGIPRGKTEIAYQPLPGAQRTFAENGDPDHILFVGWVQPRKGLLLIAEALGRVRKQFTFEAIGETADPVYAEQVKKALAGAGLEPDRCMKGRVGKAYLENAMERAGIIIIAEQWENMSPAILHEAMASGKCVVAGAIGGIPEFIDHNKNGILVRYNDPSAYAEALDRLLGDGKKQSRLGQQAALDAWPYTDRGSMSERYRALLLKLVQGRWQPAL